MFEWKVEEMRLMSPTSISYRRGKDKAIYSDESLSREDKIEAIDRFNNGEMTYILNLVNKFNVDKESLPKDKNYGIEKVKTISLKAWLKKNDVKKVFDDWFKYGKGSLLGVYFYIQDGEKVYSEYGYNLYDNIVDEIFHRLLLDLLKKEKAYFKEHDEYSILQKTIE